MTYVNVTVHVQTVNSPNNFFEVFVLQQELNSSICWSLKANTTASHVGMQLLGMLVTQTGVFT